MQKGFTLIELIIVIAILAIVATVAYNGFSGRYGEVSYGLNGRVETRCINGFMVTVGQRGYTQQMVDENGHGIKCVSNSVAGQ